MVSKCKKCSDIPKVTSGGRAEIENVEGEHYILVSGIGVY